MKDILKSIGEFFFKVTDDYLVNEINSKDLMYKIYRIYRYNRYCMIFRIPKFIKEENSLKVGNKLFSTWTIVGSKSVIHRKY